MNNITSNTFQYSKLASVLTHLENPNKETGALLVDLPSDLGKAYSGYKRGGIIEGSEKLRKEIISAAVWLFGIPAFNKLGNLVFEKIFKLPMNIDYDEKTIKQTLEYIAENKNPNNLNIKDLEKYGKEFTDKIKTLGIDKSVKKVKGAKQIITIGAWALNCALMGIIIPKLNQKATRKKLEKEKNKNLNYAPKFDSFQEFQEKNKKSNIAFKGISNIADVMTYAINNNAKARLISTDVPMIIGRCATARNKYEALEIGIMDSLAILFYNFTLGWTQNILNKICGNPTINAKIGEIIAQQDSNTLDTVIKAATNESSEIFQLTKQQGQFSTDVVKEIFKQGTNGKYGKINRFVKSEELENIQGSVQNFLINISKKLPKNPDGTYNTDNLKNIVKNINRKNAAFYAIGTVVSVLGLGILIPKMVYGITKKLTGKDGFVGIQEEDKKL